MAQSMRRSNTLGTMDHKLQRDKSRTGYFGNVKNRLGSKLPTSGSQPQELSKSPLEAEPRARCATTEARDAGRHPHHAAASGPLHHVHHIRNPKLRQYYLQGTSCELSTAQQEGASCKSPPGDTVFSITSQFDVHHAGDSPTITSSTFAVIHEKGKKSSAAAGPEMQWSAADPRLKLQPEVKSELPASPSPEAEYDKLLDVEAVPMPDGQLCLLTLPPECCQGEGPEAVPYLKLFCRYITDCKGVVSGILLVTSNKLFFDPCKSHPLVVEHGCEEYLLSCSADSLASVTFFSDITHVHFSRTQHRWKGKRSTLRTPHPGDSHDSFNSATRGAEARGPAAPGDHHRHAGPAGRDTSEAQKHKSDDQTQPRASEEEEEEEEEEQRSAAAPGGRPPSGPGGVMFVRLRTRRPSEKPCAASQQGAGGAPARRDAWLALSQESSDQLCAYLSHWRPEICILEGGEEDREGEAYEEEFVLIEDDDDDKEEEEGHQSAKGHRHSGEDWEMLSIESSGNKPTLVIDRDPECLTDILEASSILEASHVRELSTELPPRTIGHAWQLTYSTSRHGFSLKSLYRKLRGTDSPVLIVIKDALDQVFGSFLSHPLRPSETFYGTGETFLFMLHPRFKCFRWTGENTFFIKGNLDSFAIGGGSGHFGLWLDETLYLGRSSPCYTFNNCCLSEVDDFHVIAMEVWTFS